MSSGDRERRPAKADAEDIRDKYGQCSEFYAENRSEAAEIAGEEDDARHWDDVAETLAEEQGE
jgi:hypothetical protein